MKIIFPIIFVLFLTGLVTDQSLWLDEATSVLTAKNLNPHQIVTEFSPRDFHPPLSYLLLHFWVRLGGASELWVRLLSIIFTTITSIVVYKIGEQFMEKKWSVVAATLYATGPLVFYYSSEARMYALVTLFVSLTFWGFLSFLKNGSWHWWIVWVGGTVLVIYTDYMPYLILPVFLVPLILKERFSQKMSVVFWALVVTLFFIPWIGPFSHQLSLGSGVQSSSPDWSAVLGSFSLKSLPLLWVKLIIGRITFYNKFLYGIIVMVLSAIFGWLFWLSRNNKQNKLVPYLWLWLLIPPLLGLLISTQLSIFQYFRFLFIAPAFYLLLTLGIKKVGKFAAIFVLVSNLVCVGYFLANPRFYREDWRSSADYIKENLTEPAIAIFPNIGQSDPYRYYGNPAPVVDYKVWIEKKPSQVWLFRYVQEIFDPDDSIRKQLENRGYSKIEEKSFNQVLFWRYEKL